MFNTPRITNSTDTLQGDVPRMATPASYDQIGGGYRGPEVLVQTKRAKNHDTLRDLKLKKIKKFTRGAHPWDHNDGPRGHFHKNCNQ